MRSFRLGCLLATSVTFIACTSPQLQGEIPLDAGIDGGDAGTDGAVDTCAYPGVPFDVGSTTGHPAPLEATAGQARAGRITAAQLPRTPSGLGTWEDGDFVLANAKVAMVIEDAGDSDLYDPWGGKPVGFAHVRNGQLVDPSDFGEMLMFAFGPSSVVTEHVGVVADGSDGGPAIVRAEGRISPIPFVFGLVRVFWNSQTYRNDVTRFAVDYVLEPDAEHVDVYLHGRHADPDNPLWSGGTEGHGFMFSDRLLAFQPNGNGFNSDLYAAAEHSWLAFVDDRGVGYAFETPGETMKPLPSASGFVGTYSPGPEFPPCGQPEGQGYLSSRIHIGGPDADALLDAVARSHGDATRTITGHVAAAGGGGRDHVRVHVVEAADHSRYVTRTWTDANGDFTVHVPAALDVDVYAFLQGEALLGPDNVPAADTTSSLTAPAAATVHVDAAVDGMGQPIPYKLQVLPADATTTVPTPLYGNWGEELPTSGRLHVEYVLAGDSLDLVLPAGTWKLVASRGFRYELSEQVVTVSGGDSVTFSPQLVRSIDTPGVFCADFHIHTRLSNDSPDDPVMKLRSGLAEDLDLPVRSDHEAIRDWDDILTAPRSAGGLDSAGFAVAPTSVEMTTMEAYGHFGVIPAFEDPTLPNGGTPLWQTYPTAANLDAPFANLTPAELFASVHARPDSPALIVNHPIGGKNYFSYAAYDEVTGIAGRPDRWSEDFDGIEVFNDSDWLANRSSRVRAWLSFLDRGVHVVAVGSSDTHNVSGSPMGYARTCMDFNPVSITSLPQQATDRRAFAYHIRDALLASRAAVNGGVFVEASVAGVGPGGTATGLGTDDFVHLRVRAPSWMDVDVIEIVVDGQTLGTLDVAADCTQNGVVRCELDYPIPVGTANSYVVVAAYGNATMEPVMRGRIPFGMTNAIFLER